MRLIHPVVQVGGLNVLWGGCQRMMSLDLNPQQWRMATVRRETVAVLIYFYLGDFCANKLASSGQK
jgi:hypothetical protein